MMFRKGRRSVKWTSEWRTTFEGPTLKFLGVANLRMAIKQLVEEPNTTFEASAIS
ncbi:hypothetical protein HanXRQr2_Chr07g0312321 [Helianthus annuus]|uniref:Uncharacterized protein n=1 Tax=Helianthus annuus TaxID=4232 RepID=A0A9K3IP98_HELAN|nr:hypothetical protein HanXRQr2_Chr07g0312321 [Helianthus annuus]